MITTSSCARPAGPSSALEDVEVVTSRGGGGVREFERDFETNTYQTIRASTTRRPDAVSLDHKVAYSIGPIAIADPSAGGDAYTWQVRADTLGVYLARRNNTNDGWLGETLLFSYSGAGIDELSLAFTGSGYPVVAMERASHAWLYWYNPTTPGYELRDLGAGRTPRVVSDLLPINPRPCGYPVSVQLLFITSDGIVRWSESNKFASQLDIALAFNPDHSLEDVFPTAGRRLSIVISERNSTTGRYQLKRQDSKPFNPLKRPYFPGGVDDITFNPGDQWTHPPSTTHLDTYQLRVEVLDKVDGIQVMATDTDFSESTGWTVQFQDSFIIGYTSGFNPHDSIQFPFDVTHGNNTMSPRAFRARTYKTIGGVKYFSGWEYFIAGKTAFDLHINVFPEDSFAHQQTIDVTSADGQIYAQYYDGFNFVDAIFPSTNTFSCKQLLDVTNVWRTPYRFSPRNKEHFIFTDSCGDVYNFDLWSRVSTSADGTSPIFPPPAIIDTNQYPGTFPPITPFRYGDPVGFTGWDDPLVSQNEDAPVYALPSTQIARYYDPILFAGTPQTVNKVVVEFGGADVFLRVSAVTLEAQLRQPNVHGVMLLDAFGVPLPVNIEGCPGGLPRNPDDTAAIEDLISADSCCLFGSVGGIEFLLDGRFFLDGTHTPSGARE